MRQIWTYKARDPLGQAVKGEIEGESREQVFQVISEKGLIPTSVKVRNEKVTLGNFGSANREKLIIFTKKLRTLYRAGIPLMRSLAIIERGAAELDLTEEIKGIRSDLQSGLALSKTLARYPRKFPPIYVNSIAAGEASGKLEEVLEQLANLVEKEMILNRQIKSAIRYPIMVVVAISLAVFVLMSFVVPRFAAIYGKFGADLPLPTKIVIGTSEIFAGYWHVIIVLLVVLFLALKKYMSTEKGRLKWDAFTMRIPLLGELVIKANVTRFAAMLKILFQSGVPMITCLNILQETASNKVIGNEIGQMAGSFEQGRELGSDFKQYRYMPTMVLEMLEVGLESGSVESIMEEMASHYEMELDYKARHLTAMLEPLMTLVIGAMVLVLALAIFLPMWNLIQVFR
ncbi:MAG: type II secretion system F family protein [FCB group bacterium]|nr:type II secretion system F family protein [FCB group bacterium]